MKKCLALFPLILFLFIALSTATKPSAEYHINEQVFATSSSGGITEDEINNEIASQLNDLDFSELDKVINNFSIGQASIFGEGSFVDKIFKLLSGEFDTGQGLFKSIINVFLNGLVDLLPIMSLIIAISLIGNMIQGLQPSSNGKSLSNIIHFVSYGVVVVLVLSIVIKMIALTTNTLTTIQNQMNAIFPILLTLLTAIGGTSSAALYQPAMGILTNGIINLFTYVLLPIFIFSIVFSVVSNLSNTVKLDKFTSFFNSTYKWMIGLIFTIFSAFLSLQGITAGTIDGISIRTTKYAIRSYVPIVGSYISDGMGLILASSNLIKNTVGAGGLLLMLASLLAPLIEMIIFMLALKLIAGIIEPLGNRQIANFISSLSKSMVLLIALLFGVAFVYFIMLGLIVSSANIT